MNLTDLQNTDPWDWPPEAGELLHETLIDSQANEADKLIATQLAGETVVMNDDLADALLAILYDAGESEQVRCNAALSLGPVLQLADQDLADDPDNVPITEPTFRNIQDALHKLYRDKGNPKELRRRILEASVRAAEDWHGNAIKAAYASGDPEWMLTAVFSMRWVPGFDSQILDALKSTDAEIHYEAVAGAGNWELDAAWPQILALVKDANTSKPLLLVAIESAALIRPQEAQDVLFALTESDDGDIAEAADNAIAEANARLSEGNSE